MTSSKSRLATALTASAALVIVAGGGALLVPRDVAAYSESVVLPVLSLSALVIMAGLAADWRWLRGPVSVLGATLILGWARAGGSATSTRHLAGASRVPRRSSAPQPPLPPHHSPLFSSPPPPPAAAMELRPTRIAGSCSEHDGARVLKKGAAFFLFTYFQQKKEGKEK